MKIRMVPIGNASNKFTRIVPTCRGSSEKSIDLLIDGEETELDKTWSSRSVTRLIHLIRNSCDHGVRAPRSARRRRQEPLAALPVRRGKGHHIIITIEDDGKGPYVERIRKTNIERGLITEAAQVSRGDIFNLIFEPAFHATDDRLRPRVGMDLVSNRSPSSRVDRPRQQNWRGTTTTIRLPLTLAIVQSLLVESNTEIFAILSTVRRIGAPSAPIEIQRVGEPGHQTPQQGPAAVHLENTLELQLKPESSGYGSQRLVTDPTRHAAARRGASQGRFTRHRRQRLTAASASRRPASEPAGNGHQGRWARS